MRLKKNLVILISLSLFLLLTACSNSSQKAMTEPVLLDNAILKPAFELQDKSFAAGTAFAIDMPDEKVSLVLTALHLFGPDGGLEKNIPSAELPSKVKKATFKDAFTGKDCGECVKVLSIPDAKPSPDIDKDIVAFYYGDNMKVPKLKIAKELPKIGEAVWLAAPVLGGAEGQNLFKGKVNYSKDKMIFYVLEDNKMLLQGTSGAPVLNIDGEVVGINIGSVNQDGQLLGIANPCTSFKKMLQNALKK